MPFFLTLSCAKGVVVAVRRSYFEERVCITGCSPSITHRERSAEIWASCGPLKLAQVSHDTIRDAKMFPCRLCLLLISVFLMLSRFPEAENASISGFKYSQKRQVVLEKSKYCGQHLSSTLHEICDGRYNQRAKKSYPADEVNDYPVIYDLHPFQSPENAQKMLRHRRNTRSLIHEECCRNACSRSELQSYCAKR